MAAIQHHILIRLTAYQATMRPLIHSQGKIVFFLWQPLSRAVL